MVWIINSLFLLQLSNICTFLMYMISNKFTDTFRTVCFFRFFPPFTLENIKFTLWDIKFITSAPQLSATKHGLFSVTRSARGLLMLVKRYMVFQLSFSILRLHWWFLWQRAGIQSLLSPPLPSPQERALLSGAEARDLVSLTKPFSHFVVVHMNMHGSAQWALLKTQWYLDFFFFFIHSFCAIPVFPEECGDIWQDWQQQDFAWLVLFFAWYVLKKGF